ncbi:unnamed protein product [Bursaphelenchus okinawaensis]|uniref:Uncharacterized protein n=1 Tax=Bursaphelenchus okinawaensis TaxID=465554 RepID=A0A811KQ55_9BILA|nr:unnamed protein product [Bursaphelenchus okinawaensis]CAG9107768.1 unnamed protein product [Bursaphelenchus okinawaensis]
MDCSIICILSMMVQMQPDVENLKCSYCMTVDALTTDCYNDPLRCWHSSPNDLLYCLTSIEFRADIALKSRRCVAQPTFPMDKNILQLAMRQRPVCDLKSAQGCNCTTCVAPPPTTPRPFKPQYPPPRLSPPPRNRPKTLAINLGRKGDSYLKKNNVPEKAHKLRALSSQSTSETTSTRSLNLWLVFGMVYMFGIL